MKRLFKASIAILVVMILATSCTVVNKTAGVDRSRFVGTWTVTNVSFEGIVGMGVSKIFDQAAPNAFMGSTWQLTNSGNAAYTLADGTSQSIYWSYYNPGNGVETAFQFKKIYQGDKVKNVDSGYRLNISSNDGATMVLKSPVSLGSGNGYVVYTFTKKSN